MYSFFSLFSFNYFRPVLDGYCFQHLSDETKERSVPGCYIPLDLMEQFKSSELVENMRQKDDASYQNLLLNVRLGNLSESEVTMLESRVPKDNNGKRLLLNPKEVAKYLFHLLEKDPGTICLVPTVEAMNAINKECLSLLGGEVRKIACETVDGKRITSNAKSALLSRKVRGYFKN